jgi:predicted DNA-binding transcriptional regulator AlpA
VKDNSSPQLEVQQHPSDKLLDLGTMAVELGIAERSVWRAVARGEIPRPVKLGKSSRWFTSDLIAVRERLKASRN